MRISVALQGLALALGLVLCAAAPARADFLRAETEHFVIQGEVSRGDITEYARKIERFHEMLVMFRPPETDELEAPKLWIYLAANNATMRQVWPGVPTTVGGVLQPQRRPDLRGGRSEQREQRHDPVPRIRPPLHVPVPQ
ncbi:hypothetical protein [Brevundimonas sp. DC300-4]|uniref:hypothetical protein n=1 Tax=Brevundimonas sp. DC300-4 TaxID=2804594 RepID=UPI003CEB7425